MKKPQDHITLYDYLDKIGVLQKGNQAEIDEARKTYWKDYRRKYSRSKRKDTKSYTVSFTFKESKIIESAAKGFHSPTAFVKYATLAYTQSNQIGISPNAYESLVELLTLTYTHVQYFEDEEKLSQEQISYLYKSLETQENFLKQIFKKS